MVVRIAQHALQTAPVAQRRTVQVDVRYFLKRRFKLAVEHWARLGAAPQLAAHFARHRIGAHDVDHDGRKVALNRNEARSARWVVVPTIAQHVLQRHGPAGHKRRPMSVAHKRCDIACAVNALKKRLARDQLPQNEAKRVHVGLRTVRIAPRALACARAQDLWRAILDIACDSAARIAQSVCE